jgi:hypothetical protein
VSYHGQDYPDYAFAGALIPGELKETLVAKLRSPLRVREPNDLQVFFGPFSCPEFVPHQQFDIVAAIDSAKS